MAGPIQSNRWLIFAAAVVLFAEAAWHAAGYAWVSTAIGASGVKPVLVAVVKAVWLMFSLHLIVLGIVVTLASGIVGGRRIVLACALIPAADTVLLLQFLGLFLLQFPGLFVATFALAGATVLLVLGGLLQPRGAASGGGT